MLWRSDNITISTDEEVQWLRDDGISTVIDLRASDEVQITGTEVLDRHGVSHVHRAMTRKTADPVTLAKTFKAVTDYEGVGNWYLRLARARAAVLLDCLQDIAEADGGILFYCTAGKDRTGVLAAIVLLFLGADDDVIVEDYEKTGPAIDRVFQRHSAATGRPAPGQQFRTTPCCMPTLPACGPSFEAFTKPAALSLFSAALPRHKNEHPAAPLPTWFLDSANGSWNPPDDRLDPQNPHGTVSFLNEQRRARPAQVPRPGPSFALPHADCLRRWACPGRSS